MNRKTKWIMPVSVLFLTVLHIVAQARRIALLPQHIGDDRFKLFACCLRTDQHPGPCERHVLPCPRRFALVFGKAGERDTERALRTLRTQPRIDLVKRTMRCRDRERGADPLCQAIVVMRAAQWPLAIRFGAGFTGEQEDDVEIAGMGQRATA